MENNSKRKPRRKLVGNKFNMLTIISKTKIRVRNGNCYYEALCDCGNTTRLLSCNIGKTKSCGCARIDNMRLVGKSNTLSIEDYGLNRVILSYTYHAVQRSLSYSLTRDEVRLILNSACRWCDSPPQNESRNGYTDEVFRYNGIDRVDNTQGYNTENCVPCCKVCNIMKSDMSESDFIAHIAKIHKKFCI